MTIHYPLLLLTFVTERKITIISVNKFNFLNGIKNNKEIHQLLIDLGLSLADFEFKWPEELRKKFNKITNAAK